MAIGKKTLPFLEKISQQILLFLSIKNPHFSETHYSTLTLNYLTRIFYKLGGWEQPKEWHFVWQGLTFLPVNMGILSYLSSKFLYEHKNKNHCQK